MMQAQIWTHKAKATKWTQHDIYPNRMREKSLILEETLTIDLNYILSR